MNLEDPKQTPPPFSIGTRHWWHHVQGLTEPGSWCHWGTPSYHPFVGFFHEIPGTPLYIYIEFTMIYRVYDDFEEISFFHVRIICTGSQRFREPAESGVNMRQSLYCLACNDLTRLCLHSR